MGQEPPPKPTEGVWRIRTRARHSHRPAAGALVANIPIASYLPIMPGRFGRGRAERHRIRCPKTKPTQEIARFQCVGFSRDAQRRFVPVAPGRTSEAAREPERGPAAGSGTPARPGLPGSGRDLIVRRSGRSL
jgi:hypothetical protein